MRIDCMTCAAEFLKGERLFDDINESAFRIVNPTLPEAYVCAEHLHKDELSVPLPTRCFPLRDDELRARYYLNRITVE